MLLKSAEVGEIANIEATLNVITEIKSTLPTTVVSEFTRLMIREIKTCHNITVEIKVIHRITGKRRGVEATPLEGTLYQLKLESQNRVEMLCLDLGPVLL